MLNDLRVPVRLWHKVAVSDDGCWLLSGTVRPDGYRQVSVGSLKDDTRRNELGHRYFYSALVGEIPEYMTVDHECHNMDDFCEGGPSCRHRACVRPDHLVIRSMRDNVLRGRTQPAANARKTHCHRGHSFTDDPVSVRQGVRVCLTCERERDKAFRVANPEKVREIQRRADAKRSEKRKKVRT